MKLYRDPNGDTGSILIINNSGSMQRLYTPFRVICIKDVKGIKVNTQVYVDSVHGTQKGEIVFVIFNHPYLHNYFHILMKIS